MSAFCGEVRPFPLGSPCFPINGVKLYRLPSRELGQSIYWEQQHFLPGLGVSNAVQYRKQQAKR
eukprot:7941749-Alexandrium_andersonii.AAC.1